MCHSMANGYRLMKAYIKPHSRIIELSTESLLTGSQEEETVDFNFSTDVDDGWDDKGDMNME